MIPGTGIEYDGEAWTVTGESLQWHEGRGEEVTIVTLENEEGDETRATIDELADCPRWAPGAPRQLKPATTTPTQTDEYP